MHACCMCIEGNVASVAKSILRQFKPKAHNRLRMTFQPVDIGEALCCVVGLAGTLLFAVAVQHS
jgi:hypothetical protein